MTLRATIFDDEPIARLRLQRLLNELGIDVVGEGDNGEKAIEVTLKQIPDLVFLDIQMPILDGLLAAKSINNALKPSPAIIFCTAYDEHAIEAFNVNATAYLLKPFDLDDLKSAIDRSHTLNKAQSSALNAHNAVDQYLPVSSGSKIEKIHINDIVLFHALEKNVFATMNCGRKILIDAPLKEIEDKYNDLFVRTNRSTIVNKNQIIKLIRQKGGPIIILDYKSKEIPVSRRKLSSLKQTILASKNTNNFYNKDD